MSELTDRARTVLRVLAETDRDLYVREVADRAGMSAADASNVLMRFWQLGWTGRRWDGPRRYYPITEQGRDQWTQEVAARDN